MVKFFKHGHIFEKQMREDYNRDMIPYYARNIVHIAYIENIDYWQAYKWLCNARPDVALQSKRAYIRYIRSLIREYNHNIKRHLDKKHNGCYNDNRKDDINGFA